MEDGSGSGADFPHRRHEEVSLPAAGRLCDRKCVDEISARQLCLHFLPGGLPDGMSVVVLHESHPIPAETLMESHIHEQAEEQRILHLLLLICLITITKQTGVRLLYFPDVL